MSNSSVGKVNKKKTHTKMPFAHFVTNRSITLTNNQKIKTKQQVPDTSSDGSNIKFLSRN